ncbi:sulfur carrier protein ThiS [Ruminiclostridium cellobioparum]|jgi:sulfur carrier protein|uniref:sulfur carrier protein ThiS n=1 Tax=Ruminiclostridium cellobioparum TaxID=29355 RepID=UPI000481BC27|nr:sulfur carrier protein ThiS [Ruminiclostridium cellobioparum]
MRITVNGKETELEREVNIAGLLEQGYVEMQEYVTVQVNDIIVQKNEYDGFIIKEGDIIEFLYYMGGGN